MGLTCVASITEELGCRIWRLEEILDETLWITWPQGCSTLPQMCNEFLCIYGGSYANLPLAQSLCDNLMWLEKRLGITLDHFPKAFSTNSLRVSCDTTNKGSPLSIINSLRQQLPIGFKKDATQSSILIQCSSNGLGNHLLQPLVDSPSILTSDLFLAVEVCCLKVS
jgi:hypothetical protein